MKKSISILLLILVLACCLAVVACDKEATVADNTQYYDAVTKKLKLSKSYQGKSFLNDGIGTATVDAYTDGDTTRFSTADGTVIVRYYCIDTPESTGEVQKWGKAASLFVKEALSKATEIVLESSTGTRPSKDSYGTRYLAYVWYKTADYNEFKLLNLELIENGFTDNKALNTDAYPYYSYMNEANQFARSIKLRLYSDLDDPLFSTDPVAITIKDFWENQDNYYNVDTDAGSKVTLTAYLESLTISKSGTYMFVAAQYDEQTGNVYKINVYAAYSSNAASKMKLGQLYELTGTIQKYGSDFQISGVVYNSMYGANPNKTYAGYTGSRVVQENYFLTFNSEVAMIDQYNKTLYTDVTVKSAQVKDGVLTIVGTSAKRTADGIGEAQEFTFETKVADGYVNTFEEGKKFSVQGYQLVDKSGKIVIPKLSDITTK